MREQEVTQRCSAQMANVELCHLIFSVYAH